MQLSKEPPLSWVTGPRGSRGRAPSGGGLFCVSKLKSAKSLTPLHTNYKKTTVKTTVNYPRPSTMSPSRCGSNADSTAPTAGPDTAMLPPSSSTRHRGNATTATTSTTVTAMTSANDHDNDHDHNEPTTAPPAAPTIGGTPAARQRSRPQRANHSRPNAPRVFDICVPCLRLTTAFIATSTC